MELILTPNQSEEYFYNALCNGLYYWSDYGLRLKYNKDHYAQAKSKLSDPCFEDVLMQILRDGNTIEVEDLETDGAFSKQISLKDVHEKVSTVDRIHLDNMMNEHDDADTADAIIQTVFYGERVFG